MLSTNTDLYNIYREVEKLSESKNGQIRLVRDAMQEVEKQWQHKTKCINRYSTKIKDLLLLFQKIIFNTKLDTTNPGSLTALR